MEEHRSKQETVEAKPTNPSNPRPEISFPFTCTTHVTESSVILSDWWLIKVDGKKLGIGGFTHSRGVGVRYFASASVSVRHCDNVLETTDGIEIMICGLLNLERTHQNGFPPLVCSKFIHGFPFNWEEYKIYCTENESVSERTSSRASMPDESESSPEEVENKSSLSLDNVSMTNMRDLLMSTFGSSAYDLMIDKICSDYSLGSPEKDSSEHQGVSEDPNLKAGSVDDVEFSTNSAPVAQEKAE